MGACHEDQQSILPVQSAMAATATPVLRKEESSLFVACLHQLSGFLLLVIIVIWMLITLWISGGELPLECSVAITGVSGLGPVMDLPQGRGLLHPEFNLTIGITSCSAKGGCIQPRTSIKVSYSDLRIPVAGGRAPEMCVGPWQSIERRLVVAGGHDVALPGFLVDSFAEDIRRGDAVFEVKLMVQESDKGWKMVTCWAMLGDASGAALKIPCEESTVYF